MRFEKEVKIYGVNDDGTVTFSYENDDKKYDYIRASARYSVLKRLEELERGTSIMCQFGLAYVRSRGLVLQLINFTYEQN